jgi:hypothetical protein
MAHRIAEREHPVAVDALDGCGEAGVLEEVSGDGGAGACAQAASARQMSSDATVRMSVPSSP